VPSARFEKTKTADLLALLRYASRRRANPFAVTEALVEVLRRQVSPPELGAAVLTFDATLAAEARDALDGVTEPSARFLQATVPADVDGPRVELAWQAAAGALSRLLRLTQKPKKDERLVLERLAVDEVYVEGAQVALSTAAPDEVEATRWFFPLLTLEGSEASVDALLPHVDAALTARGDRLEVFRPLVWLLKKTPANALLEARLKAALAAQKV